MPDSEDLQIVLIPLLSDNYAYLLHDKAGGKTAVVDPSEATPVLRVLERRKLNLDFVLNTHHHADHVGGNLDLKSSLGCKIIGPKREANKIPGIDIELDEGDTFVLGNSLFRAIHTPGHTLGQVQYFFPDQPALFSGDTLFALGCGRLFEGTAEQMWGSLKRLRELPGNTKVYCGHEYTQANARFALSIDPENPDLQKRNQWIQDKRSENLPTIPFQMSEEVATSPFMRPDCPRIRKRLGMEKASDVEVFAAIRAKKDAW